MVSVLIEVSLAPDSITLLRCEDGRRLAKRFRVGVAAPDDYDGGLLFQVATEPIGSLADLHALLIELESAPDVCVVRGEPKADIAPDEWVQRLAIDRPDVLAAFVATPRRWLMIDLDGGGSWFDQADPIGSIETLRATWPEPLRSAGMVWQFSAKAHISSVMRGHAWFMLDAPASDGALRRWAEQNGYDASVYTPVAIHYTAAPIFDGAPDPLAGRRIHLFDGPALHLDLDAADDGPPPERSRSYETGDPTPRYDAARRAVLAALGPAEDHQGRRWAICGPLGGACRKQCWPAGEVAELVREWLAPEGAAAPGIDAEAGVQRALGAYTLTRPEQATGVGELAAILGDESAATIGSALAWPVWPSRTDPARIPPAPAPPEPTEDEPFPEFGARIRISTELPPLEYACEALRLAPGKISIVGGYAGTSKGPFMNLIAVARAHGLPIFGDAPVEQGHTLFLDYETGKLAIHRIQRICAGLEVDPVETEPWLDFYEPELDPTLWLDALDRYADQTPNLMVCLDSYTSAMFGLGLESNRPEYASIAHSLGRFSSRRGVVVLASMHTRKDQSGREPDLTDIAGTNSLAAMVQTAILLKRPNPTDETLIEVTCARAPQGRFEPFRIRWAGDAGEPLRAIPEQIPPRPIDGRSRNSSNDRRRLEKEDNDRRGARAILAELEATQGVQVSTKRLKEVSGIRDVYRILRDLRDRGVIAERSPGYYVLAPGATAAQKRFT